MHDPDSRAVGQSDGLLCSPGKKPRSFEQTLAGLEDFCASCVLRLLGASRSDGILGEFCSWSAESLRTSDRLLPLRGQLHVSRIRRCDHVPFLEIARPTRNGEWNAAIWGFDRDVFGVMLWLIQARFVDLKD